MPLRGLVVALVLATAMACTPGGTSTTSRAGPPTAAEPPSCGPLTRASRNACAHRWLPTRDGFVPQGLAVAGRTAWVGGVDADGQPRTCVVVRVDLRRGTVRDRVDLPRCWHGGGLVRDEHGLWLVDTRQLLLLDEDELTVQRTWRLLDPLRGSFATGDDAGRLGLGRWHPRRPGVLDWVETEALLAPGVTEVGAAQVVGSVPAPARAQGAVVLGGRWSGVWFSRSVTRCGILVGPGGRRRALVPGAEGLARSGEDAVWVVSEAGSAYYQRQGGRPRVPTLIRLDVTDLATGPRPDCTV
ncbi:hypothetical protein [Nocardioides dongkuii]|uniref:hypothetical protein n=1 Tax=Nocardioides dongkuii TaxID=2760089 RepID=UPI0015F9F1ED|nr:hypothetical protein [Nocardioides dongkuii]